MNIPTKLNSFCKGCPGLPTRARSAVSSSFGFVHRHPLNGILCRMNPCIMLSLGWYSGLVTGDEQLDAAGSHLNVEGNFAAARIHTKEVQKDVDTLIVTIAIDLA